jgi:hypothetical protein
MTIYKIGSKIGQKSIGIIFGESRAWIKAATSSLAKLFMEFFNKHNGSFMPVIYSHSSMVHRAF